MSLTPEEKIVLVSARYDPDTVVDILELTTEQLLRAFPDELEAKWGEFDDIETDIEDFTDAN